MPNIVKELSLNKHPKDCKDLSLINARNIMVSNDFSCLQNELNITEHPTLQDYLEDKILVGYIPCNTEVVLFTVSDDDYDSLKSNKTAIDSVITRYDEESDEIIECLSNFKYHGGKIVGTFTYNVQNNLIIAVAESDTITGDIVPLRSINLGKFDEETKGTDRELNAGLHAVSPELILPKFTDFAYVPGKTYKGWYYFFIRYKINNIDYTHWFPIGHPIFICDIEKQTIFKYGYRSDRKSHYPIENQTPKYTLSGAIDYFSSKSNIANETVDINLTNFDERYSFYQIGFICVAKDSSKAFRTNDIEINNKIFNLSIAEANSYSVEELIFDNYNYYNVKNVINYQNRLYISNFKENSNPIISNEELSKIKLTFNRKNIAINDVAYQLINVEENTNNVISKEDRSVDDIIDDYDVLPAYPVYTGTDANRTIDSIKLGESFDYRETAYTEGVTEHGYLTTRGGNHIPAECLIWKHNMHKNIRVSIVLNGTTYNCYYVSSGIINPWYQHMVCDFNSFYDDMVVSGAGSNIGQNVAFINTNNSFKRRKHDKTLIPGEIYNFYIHFVNKYGEATDGYRIPNKIGEQNIQYVAVDFDSDRYVEFPINQKVFNEEGRIYISGNENIVGNILPIELDLVLNIKYGSLRNIPDLRWYQIPNVTIKNNNQNCFIPFINTNNDILHKVPFEDCTYDGTIIYYPEYTLNFDLNNFTLPKGYIGYYFSYEKFESTIKYRGILTKFDISTQDKITAVQGTDEYVEYNEYNDTDITNIDNVNFYCSNIDIDDELNLDFNSLLVIKDLTLHTNDVIYNPEDKVEFANAKYPANLNRLEYDGTDVSKIIGIDKYNLVIAGDVLKNRNNIGSSIEIASISDIINLFAGNKKIFKSALLKLTKNIYTNENKILIKFTDVYYEEKTGEIISGLNGCATYNDFIVFDYNRFIFNTQNNVVLSEKYGQYYPTDTLDVWDNNTIVYVLKTFFENGAYATIAPLYYAQIFTYDVIYNEAKCFKNEPSIYYLSLEATISDDKVTNQIKQFAQNIITLPENTVDLFENKYTSQDALNPKTFVNYDVNKEYIDTYNKRVRRSNVIADESNENSWRVFPLEGYKDITENKGIITNIVGVGTTFLVHTEHSLFMFDRNNTLQTADKEVQLAMPDIFDVDYKEVFTSDLGICGLQDRDAHIVDQFGYIFYDNDAHRIYKFGQGKIENIDLDIIQFLNKYKPYRIRFANDKEASRLLVNMYFHSAIEAIPQEETLSFNYVINKWISFHDYVFDAAFNTKQMLYYLINRKDDNVNVYTHMYIINDLFNYKDPHNSIQNIYYNKFENIRENRQVNASVNSVIDIICNPSYEHIKYLEYIAYKLYKINIDSNTYSPTPVEELKQPYSGDTLRVFNTEVDTGLLNILVDDESYDTKKNKSIMNYKKPWWELGNWNFNYLRDKKQGNVRFPSRLYGNYFVIRFILKDDCRRIEFESLEYQITKDKP